MYFQNLFYRVKIPKDYDSRKLHKKEVVPRGVSIPVLTERQSSIISGEARNVTKREISVLINKLDVMGLDNELLLVQNKYVHLLTKAEALPLKYTPVEAEGILQSLTPWILAPPKEKPMKEELKLCDRLKAAMKKAHLKQHDLAKLTGISDGSISQYCNGNQTPRKEAISKLSKALKVDPDWLAGTTAVTKDSVHLLALYDRLDEIDKRRVFGLTSALLKDTKYRRI